MSRLTELAQWQDLEKLSQRTEVKEYNEEHILECAGISFDYSKQYISQQVFNNLIELAKSSGLPESIDDYFSGEKINFTEERAVLHTALRAPFEQTAALVSEEVAASVKNALKKMADIVNTIRHSKWFGYSGKPIRNIVNIGIGGSDLGPRLSVAGLKEFSDSYLDFYFISDADPTSFIDVVENLSPEETLFIISSKSFTTKETLINAKKAMEWINQAEHFNKHFIAVTAEPQKAMSFGIKTILPIWEWVGGRFSLCSAVNLILMIAIGIDDFCRMLQGAYDMDKHFRTADYLSNIPVLLALIGIWNINFRHINTHALMIYNSRLKDLPFYLQQLEMESNGKSFDKEGNRVDYATCPIIWGGIGNQAQHSYYQLLVQGTQKVSLDFIFDESKSKQLIYLNGQRKVSILAHGEQTNDRSDIKGEMPLNVIKMRKLSPYTLGALIAVYEHKVFTQGVIWRINSFDQFGVESSKVHDIDLKQALLKI